MSSPHPQITQRTRIVFPSDTPVGAVADTVCALSLPLTGKAKFALEYGVCEAVFNAVRASAEAGITEPVLAELFDDGETVSATVEDVAGGFDLGVLPYDFSASTQDIDVTSERFERYQAEHGNLRFGLGILTTRAMVADYSLVFLDADGQEAEWSGKGSVRGTRVRFRVSQEMRDRNRRSANRRRIHGKATTPEGIKAHVCDLSLGGAGLVIMSKPVPKLDEVYDLHIALEDGEALEVEVRARIAWVERMGDCYDVGAQFVDIGDEPFTELHEMIEELELMAHADAMNKIQVEIIPRDEPPAADQ